MQEKYSNYLSCSEVEQNECLKMYQVSMFWAMKAQCKSVVLDSSWSIDHSLPLSLVHGRRKEKVLLGITATGQYVATANSNKR